MRNQQQAAPAEQERKVLYQPFEWSYQAPPQRRGPDGVPAYFNEANAETDVYELARLSDLVRDITGGVAVVMGMLERDDIDGNFDDENGDLLPRLVSEGDAGALRRMCIRAVEWLSREAERTGECLDQRVMAARELDHG